jgi:hypothetical protein
MTSKKSGITVKSGGGAKPGKSRAKQGLKDLQVRNAKGVRGGEALITCRKAGKLQG